MPRERISMSPEEVAAFAATQQRACLATRGDEGPYGDVVACELREGVLLFAVPRGSRSHANIRRDPRVCCILEASGSYYAIKGVMIHGTAAELVAPPLLPTAPAHPAGDDEAVYRLELTDVVSFDFGKIQRRP